jgi:hypothetical protein
MNTTVVFVNIGFNRFHVPVTITYGMTNRQLYQAVGEYLKIPASEYNFVIKNRRNDATELDLDAITEDEAMQARCVSDVCMDKIIALQTYEKKAVARNRRKEEVEAAQLAAAGSLHRAYVSPFPVSYNIVLQGTNVFPLERVVAASNRFIDVLKAIEAELARTRKSVEIIFIEAGFDEYDPEFPGGKQYESEYDLAKDGGKIVPSGLILAVFAGLRPQVLPAGGRRRRRRSVSRPRKSKR